MGPLDRVKLAFTTARFLRSQWWSSQKIAAYQDRRLQQILGHSSAAPYVRQAVGPQRSDETPRDWLRRFPVMTKADMQRAGYRPPAAWPDSALYRSKTSGSTGEPTITWFDGNCWLATRYALKARRLVNFMRPTGMRVFVVSDQPRTVSTAATALPGGAGLFGFRSMALDEPLETAIENIRQFRPTMLQGFPSYLAHLADLARQDGQVLPAVPVVFTSSELLTASLRSKIERAFSARVIDVYGSTEFKEIAVQCRHGRYHINFESVYVESAPDPSTGRPRLLLTSLLNRAMPLIRYDIGDSGTVNSGRCDCGREGPYVHDLGGRSAELLRFPDGSVLSAYVLTPEIEEFGEILSYSLIHKAPDAINLKVFARPSMARQRREALETSIRKHLPDDVRVTTEVLTQRPPIGKRVAVKREFDVADA